MFSVVGDEVNMRASPSPAANIVARVRQGHMVVNLGEVNDGWYKVEIMQNKVQQMGYIKGSLLTPVILADSNATTGYSYWDLQAGAIPLPDEARVKEDLLKFGIPGIIRLDRTQRLGWNFESLSEIKSYKPWGANFLNGDCSYYVSADLELENERTGRQCRCRVTMRYNVSRNAWKCMHIADEYFEEIGKPQQSPSNANQRYPEYRPPVDNGYARPYSYGHPPSAPNQNNTDVGITANTGSLKVELSDRNPITIAIDRRQYRVHGASVTVNQLPYGLHTLKIFSYGSDRYGRVHTGIIFEGKVQTGMLTSVVYDFRTHNINIQQLH